MNYSEYIERTPHGTEEFPIEFYRLDRMHHRYEMNLHWHPEAELLRVYHGRFTLYLNGQCILLEEGDAAIINPGTLHRGIPEDCLYGCAVFKTEMLSPPGAAVGKYVRPITAQASAVREYLRASDKKDACAIACIDRLFEALDTHGTHYELAVYSHLYALFFTLCEIGAIEKNTSLSHVRHTEHMTKLLSWIDENYSHPITLSDLSKVSGFNEKYLCRFFREQTSYTPIDYINRLRVERAADDLILRHRSVTEAAFANGFNDSAYFSKVFRRIKGLSPREFAEKNKE